MKEFGRLKKNKDFATVCKFGRRWSSPFFNIYIKENDINALRLGVSVSKRIGNAVKRNKVKRRLREAFRFHREHICSSVDVVIAAKPPIVEIDYLRITSELMRFLKRGRVWYD